MKKVFALVSLCDVQGAREMPLHDGGVSKTKSEVTADFFFPYHL